MSEDNLMGTLLGGVIVLGIANYLFNGNKKKSRKRKKQTGWYNGFS